MDSRETEREQIERAIARARDGVSDRLNELDDRVRTDYSPKTLVRAHAPKIIAGGIALGLLVGFVLPKSLRRLIAIGVPLVLVAVKVRKAIGAADGTQTALESPRDYPI